MKNVLCIDPSASHLAYVISEVQGDELYIKAAGMLWTKGSWSRGERFLYMDTSLESLIEGIKTDTVPDSVTTEAYFVNFKNKVGVAVIPTINGLIEKNCAKHKVDYSELSASSWRSVLGIKKKNGDFKEPTKHKVEEYIGKVPEEITSNITLKSRNLPHDLTDALAISIARAEQQGIKKVVLANGAFYPFSIIEKLNKISKEI